ncbi:MAG: phage portal protein [Phycisphaerae bacterium]|jgi:capsid protein
MSVLGNIRRMFRPRAARPDMARFAAQVARTVRAKYDAAETSDEDRRWWASADNLSADAANSADVRRKLRNRTRYEVANNGFARGIANTLANYVVGTGPRLQVLLPDREQRQFVEREFSLWARRVRLADKLRLMRETRVVDGEAFLLLRTNRGREETSLDREGVRRPMVMLDVQLIEADRIATPTLPYPTANAIDGIRFDPAGNPIEYHLLRRHPGDMHLPSISPWDYEPVEAQLVIHYFRHDRAGQHRGVPEYTPVLRLFAFHRRFVLATIRAAEAAADFAVMLETDAPADPDAVESAEDIPLIEIERGMLTPMPAGYKANQLRPEHPSTTFESFHRRIVGDVARVLNMPLNIALGDSSGLNYSSGRLDHQSFHRSIAVDRRDLEDTVLDRLFAAWLDEAVLIDDYLPRALRARDAEVPHTWMWPGFGSIDAQKEETAREKRLQNGMSSYPTEFAAAGQDWEIEQEQQAAALGVSLTEYRELLRRRLFGAADATAGKQADRPEIEPEDADESEERRAAA